jgi:mannose-6-phosphate isomerase
VSNALNEPLYFSPIYKEKIWGGQAFRHILNRDVPPTASTGESWEISGFGNEQTKVIDGPMAQYTLGQIMKIMPEELLGSAVPSKIFPLLYKFLDADQKLSVQVHPDDAQAKQHGWGDYGKTECWYIIDAPEDGRIIVGFNKNVTRDEVAAAVSENRLHEILNHIPVASGDILFIPAGTVHAILDKTLIYEVQETSDTTLRLYDWGRTDSNGKPRDLHVNDALEVMDTGFHNRHRIEPVIIDETGFKHAYRIACRYFAIEQYTLFRDMDISLDKKKSFRVMTVIGEPVHLVLQKSEMDVSKGETILIPAACKEVTVAGVSGARFLISYIPDLVSEIIQPLTAIGVPKEAIALLGGNPEKNDLLPLL